MKKHLSTKLKVVLVLAVVLALGIGIYSYATSRTAPGESVMQTLLSPVRSGFRSLTDLAERYYNYIFSYEKLEAENKSLKSQVAAMEQEVRTADSLQRENERLRQLLKLTQDHEDYDFESAYIVSWDSSNYQTSFTISKGSSSGLAKGMVAVTEYGQVVGLISNVSVNSATVTTVLDSSLQISGSVASSGYTGIVQGAFATGYQGKLRMDYLPTVAVIRNNDQVVTTGSTVYPKGLILGYIEQADFDATGVAKYAILSPAADFDNLEQIFLITNYESK